MNFQYFFLPCMMIAAQSAPACSLPQPPAEAPYLSPAYLVNSGHDLRVKAALSPVVEAEPSNASAAWMLSKSLAGLGDLETALKLAERAVSLAGDNAAYHVQLAAVLGRMAEKASMFKQLGLARRAKKELDTSISLDPDNLDGLYGEMLYYFLAPSFVGGDKAKAGQLTETIAAVNPVRGWLAKAALAHEKKDDAAELDFYRRAVAADPDSFDARTALGQALLNQKQPDYPALEQTGCELLRIDPKRPDGWRLIAEVRAASLCWTELDDILETAARFNADDLSPYYAAATAMLRSGERLSAAQTYMEKYVSAPPDGSEPAHAMAIWQLGVLLEKQARIEDAIAQLEIAVKEDPTLDGAKKDLKRLKAK